MRCLVVADLHYSLPQFDWLLSAAPHFDVVIFAGDALDVGSRVDFRAQIVVVKKYLSLLSGLTRVIVCSGNHDLDDRNPEGEKIARWIGDIGELGIACDGGSLSIGDTLFTGGTDRWSSSASTISFATPRRHGRSDGSGSITRRLINLRPAGAASVFSATSNSRNGSRAISHRW